MKKVVVFGIFDGVHDGHRSLFSEAKKYGNYLVVLVGRDRICKKLKNKTPMHSQEERVKIVEEEKNVDKALLGDSKISTYKVLNETNPNIVCLGYDQMDLYRDLRSWKKRMEADFTIVKLSVFNPYSKIKES